MASSDGVPETDGLFNESYTEVKKIEKRDSVLTPKQQIERLLRSGSTYFNLNPFEVLQVEPETSLEELKTKYRRMSILVHPDKNQEDKERAQAAFEAVNRAWKTLENPDSRARCMEVVEEAKAKTDINVAEKKKKLKREGKSLAVDEDDGGKYKHAIWVMTMKLFADMERKRRHTETRDMEERKRKREGEIDVEEKNKMEKEWMKNFEESREGRVASWKTFQSNASKGGSAEGGLPPPSAPAAKAAASSSATNITKKSKKMKTFRPPKHKAETR